MKIVIIEDEHYAAEALQRMLLNLKPDAQIIKVISSVEEGWKYFFENPEPDLLFCDIHLSDGISFEIFNKYPIKCPVIFTTAFDQYAIQAFDVNSINYLLKPIKKEDLRNTLLKYEDRLKVQAIDYNRLNQLLNKPTDKTRFSGSIGRNLQVVEIDRISYFLASEGLVSIHTTDKKRLIIDYTLDNLEQILDPKFFFRANRQIIIHIQSLKKVAPYFKGRLLLYLTPETTDKQTVSQNKASSFKKWMEGL